MPTTIIFRARSATVNDIMTQRSTVPKCWKKAWKLGKLKWTNLDRKNMSTRKRVCDIMFVKRTVGLMVNSFCWESLFSVPSLSPPKEKNPPKIWAEMKLKWRSVTRANQSVCGWRHWKAKIPTDETLWWNGVPPVKRKNQKSGESDRKRSSLAIVTLEELKRAMTEWGFSLRYLGVPFLGLALNISCFISHWNLGRYNKQDGRDATSRMRRCSSDHIAKNTWHDSTWLIRHVCRCWLFPESAALMVQTIIWMSTFTVINEWLSRAVEILLRALSIQFRIYLVKFWRFVFLWSPIVTVSAPAAMYPQ